MTITAPNHWLFAAAARLVPPVRTGTVIDWLAEHLRDPGSARSEKFDPSITPWIIEPTNCYGDGVTRTNTFVKPVQSGGSKVGEGIICYDIHHAPGGDIAYYWPNGEKAKDRWEKRIERLLRATKPIAERLKDLETTDNGRFKITKGRVLFPHLTLAMLGAYNQRDVESDSYRLIVNEEVHDNHNSNGWLPGRLKQTYGRATAYWNSFILNISNAGVKGDQLYEAFHSGTQEHWQVKCPGCGQYHIMRTRWNDERPDIGGLRYDSAKCKRQDGSYDYNKIQSTIRFQMPCGFIVRDVETERRPLSLSGRYSEPTNTGATLANRSFTLEAVSVDYIPWLTLIQEKHDALRALKYGDVEPWKRYLQERECEFFDPHNRPLVQKLQVNILKQKSREGLPDRVLRAMAIDKQHGVTAKGETPHHWVLIRDFRADASSELVYEGKVPLIEDVEKIREDHGVVVGNVPDPSHVAMDSGYLGTEVYRICARYGYIPFKGEDRDFYIHDDEERQPDGSTKIIKVRRIYSPLQHIDAFEGDTEGRAGKHFVTLVLFSNHNSNDRLAWLMSRGRSVNEEWNDALEAVVGKENGVYKFWSVPSDVSKDYREHIEAEEQQEMEIGRSREVKVVWVQIRPRNDLRWCERAVTILADMAGLLGAGVPEPK